MLSSPRYRGRPSGSTPLFAFLPDAFGAMFRGSSDAGLQLPRLSASPTGPRTLPHQQHVAIQVTSRYAPHTRESSHTRLHLPKHTCQGTLSSTRNAQGRPRSGPPLVEAISNCRLLHDTLHACHDGTRKRRSPAKQLGSLNLCGIRGEHPARIRIE